ncbi:MAG: XrtA system polysaccharide deacetylase [Planctomycetota bacterium JB042]
MTGPDETIANGLSFDVEEYFHALNLRPVAPAETWERQERRVAATTRAIVEALAARDVTATFYFLGWVAKRDPALVKEVAAAGHEVGSHGMSHRMAGELGPDAFRDEARESKAILEDAIGAPIRGFRASTFSVTEETRWAFDVLREEGYAYDSSVFPVRHDRYGWPSFSRVPVEVETASGPLLELPMLTLRRFGMNLPAAGGGYLRLLPLGLVHRALKEMNAAGHPGVVYLHPWEFDPGQPRLLKGGLGAFRHYFGLDRTMGKLERLLDRHAFGTVGALAPAPS